MILTCPECATRFKIADDAIGANGRTVRCSQCSATWFVAAEPDVLDLADAKENTEIREEIIRESVSDIETERDLSSEISDKAHPKSVDDGFDTKLDDALPAIGAHAGIRETADRKKMRKRLLGVGLIWLIPLVIISLFVLGAYLFRAQVVEKFPGTAPVYRGFGL